MRGSSPNGVDDLCSDPWKIIWNIWAFGDEITASILVLCLEYLPWVIVPSGPLPKKNETILSEDQVLPIDGVPLRYTYIFAR